MKMIVTIAAMVARTTKMKMMTIAWKIVLRAMTMIRVMMMKIVQEMMNKAVVSLAEVLCKSREGQVQIQICKAMFTPQLTVSFHNNNNTNNNIHFILILFSINPNTTHNHSTVKEGKLTKKLVFWVDWLRRNSVRTKWSLKTISTTKIINLN